MRWRSGWGDLQTDEGVLISSVISDISERKLAEEAGAHLAAIVESSDDGIVGKTLEGTITSWNPAAERMYGYTAEEAVGRHVSVLCPSAEQLHELADILRRVAAGSRVDHFETTRLCKDGRVIDVSVTVSPIRDRHGQVSGASTVARDITERKRYEDRLQHLVDHDPLTGLLNRHSFSLALDSHAALVGRYGAEGALLMLDLDHFKYVNDTLGHQGGDEIIARAAELLAGRLRESDILARLGGDEFAALLPKADAQDAERVALELLQVFTEQPIPVIGAGARAMTASIGVATFEPQLSGEDVLVNADLAMYDAKDAGRNRIALYRADEHDQAHMKGRLSWVSRIQTALADDRFRLLAQPIIDYSTGRVSQHELLLRMSDEDGRLIAPGAFLHIAERLDLVQQIDAWVIQKAIGLLAESNTSDDRLPLSINLSGRSLGEPKLLELIEHELDRTGVAPDRLTFEITETAAITAHHGRPAVQRAPRATRLPARARRLRRRFRILLLPQAPAVRLPQDRRRIRPQLHQQQDRPARDRSRRRDRSRTRKNHDRRTRRRRRNRPPTRPASASTTARATTTATRHP